METGVKAGIKPAGGISTSGHALMYAGIVRSILGEEWLDPALFRIGASRLANDILTDIESMENNGTGKVKYF
jgi:deoxyribose-phosphate aldolase